MPDLATATPVREEIAPHGTAQKSVAVEQGLAAPIWPQPPRGMRALPHTPDQPSPADPESTAAAVPANGAASFGLQSHSGRREPIPTVRERLRILAALRSRIAEDPTPLTTAISADLPRNPADTLVAEVLPLLAACRFLERNAARLLAPQRLGRRGRPAWLPGVSHCVERIPLGRVLVIGPANYPLFLPGVQVLQALVAGNTVLWKPGQGGEPVARALAALLAEAGLPPGTLTVTGESATLAGQLIAAGGIDKIILTGSAETGRAVFRQAAETLTPVVAELSGCDSVIVLPGADLERVVRALTFGMRLNGSATCMAPRRLLLVASPPDRTRDLLTRLRSAFARTPGVRLPASTGRLLGDLLEDARTGGATLSGEFIPLQQQPLLLTGVTPAMRIARTDLFAPVLSIVECADRSAALAAEAASPFALTCSICGDNQEARSLARELRCGNVVLNDVIVPTADPRIPFAGRKQSGFGVTRGAEGLLEMTAVRVISTRRGTSTRHLQPTTAAHEPFFRALGRFFYAGTWRSRLLGARQLGRTARNLDHAGGSRRPDSGAKPIPPAKPIS